MVVESNIPQRILETVAGLCYQTADTERPNSSARWTDAANLAQGTYKDQIQQLYAALSWARQAADRKSTLDRLGDLGLGRITDLPTKQLVGSLVIAGLEGEKRYDGNYMKGRIKEVLVQLGLEPDDEAQFFKSLTSERVVERVLLGSLRLG